MTEQHTVGEDENEDKFAEKDAARISWLQWLASKSKLTTRMPTKTKTTNTKINEKEDPFESLFSSGLKFPGILSSNNIVI